MNRKFAAVVQKRQALVARAAGQRAELEVLLERWRGPLAVVDGAYRLGQALRQHPAISAVVLASLVRRQRFRMLRWGGALLTLWQIYHAYREQWPRRPER